MNEFEKLFDEHGQVVESALQKLIGLFGPTGGEIVHGILQVLATASQSEQQQPQVKPQDTAVSQQ